MRDNVVAMPAPEPRVMWLEIVSPTLAQIYKEVTFYLRLESLTWRECYLPHWLCTWLLDREIKSLERKIQRENCT
jgi:hypothetical protein